MIDFITTFSFIFFRRSQASDGRGDFILYEMKALTLKGDGNSPGLNSKLAQQYLEYEEYSSMEQTAEASKESVALGKRKTAFTNNTTAQ